MKSRRVEILVAAVVLFVIASPVMGVLEFNDAGAWDIDYEINDDVWVDYASAGMGTTVNMLDGGSIPYHHALESFEDSIINILGGSTNSLDAWGSSQVTVSGGSIDGSLQAYDSTQVTVSDGSIGGLLGEGLIANGSSQITVSGGSIYRPLYAYDSGQVTVSGGSMDWLYASGRSQVNVSGGSIDMALYAYDSSQVTVSGGSIKWEMHAHNSSQVAVSGGSTMLLYAHDSGQVTVSGGSMNSLRASGSSQVIVSGGLFGGELRLWDNAVLTIDGSDFAVDGTPVGYTELMSTLGLGWSDEPSRELTGTLLNGDPLDSYCSIGNNAKIVLVPEPATLLILGFGGMALLRRRKQA